MDEGKYCPYCGSANLSPQTNISKTTPSSNSTQQGMVVDPKRIEVLEEKIQNYMIYGIISIFVFWPLAIYFFIVRSNDEQELKRLKANQ